MNVCMHAIMQMCTLRAGCPWGACLILTSVASALVRPLSTGRVSVQQQRVKHNQLASANNVHRIEHPARLSSLLHVSTSTETLSDERIPYDWKDKWYALTFASYIPNPSQSAETVPAAVFGHPLVLWRGQDGGPISCADDVCPHRSAALSEGRVRDGRIECLYHGWQYQSVTSSSFTSSKPGSCISIPQLPAGASIPKAACLRMREVRVVEGIVWVWMGDNGRPTFDPPQSECRLHDENPGKEDGFNVYDFQIDLPYDHSYLVENLIDPAHIVISHDRTEGGGNREDATAYDMQVDEDSFSDRGFKGQMRTAASATKGGPFRNVTFEAPGIVRYHNVFGNIVFSTALHCMPLSLGRSRLLFRTMRKGFPWRFVDKKPKWLRHLNSCKILEQDMGLITTQVDHFARNPGRTLGDDFLLLGSSDKFVGAYRRWLDRVGHGMPWFQGLVSSSNVNVNTVGTMRLPPGLDPAEHCASGQDVVETRYHRHVMHSPVTRNALRNVQRLKRTFMAVTVLAVTAALGLAPVVAASGVGGGGVGYISVCRTILHCLLPFVPLSVAGAAAAHELEQRFFVSFKRKDQLRGEKGI